MTSILDMSAVSRAVAAGAGLMLVGSSCGWHRWWRRKSRGACLASYWRIRLKTSIDWTRQPKGKIFFGGVWLPREAATSHFMIVGTIGSGKTLMLNMMMNSVLPQIWQSPEAGQPRNDARAVIFDEKQEMVSTLRGIGVPNSRLLILNPFDMRCHAWDIAADVTGPDTALQLAAMLIPVDEGHNRFFSDSARELLRGVITAFIRLAAAQRTSPAWDLADIILAMRSEARLRHVLSQTEEGRDLIGSYLSKSENVGANIIATARSHLSAFDVIAALWQRAGRGFRIEEPDGSYRSRSGRKISLQEFMKGNQVLILGNNQRAKAAIETLNQLLFQRLTELVLNQSDNDQRRTWFFLDEARKLGRLRALPDLMNNGRSKGACVVLGFQDFSGLEHAYGPALYKEITDLCGSYGFLKLGGVETPERAARIIGLREEIHWRESISASYGREPSVSTSQSEELRQRTLVMAEEFRSLPNPRKGDPICGYFCSRFLSEAFRDKPYKAKVPPELIQKMLPVPSTTDPNLVDWPDSSYFYVLPWQTTDYARLCLPEPASPTGETAGDTQGKTGGTASASGDGTDGSPDLAPEPDEPKHKRRRFRSD